MERILLAMQHLLEAAAVPPAGCRTVGAGDLVPRSLHRRPGVRLGRGTRRGRRAHGIRGARRRADGRPGKAPAAVLDPCGAELARCQAVYFTAFPDGPTRLTWQGMAYFRVRPRWVRYSDFTVTPTRNAPLIVEQTF